MERDRIEELKPNQEAAQKTFRDSCGCDVAVNVKYDTFPTADDMKNIDNTLESLVSSTKAICEKPADKAAVCSALSEVEISFVQHESAVKLEGKKIVANTGAQSYSTDLMFTSVFNTF